ncbi:GNAT family N-acetyltransferase [Rhodobium gokarnense]|uniref:Ribosomal protein S18 acetylase RimI-like enzyme n=1 Tax=Rhodobium gokarnense TaxID=364296 RepID=A0ABT3HD83_9HYPH|nr:GNAT family N-acetyltransferase [Rhodobium gokarnense]MCW2308294.1 ribosomal protein S18 acetylase RimI-like enzyme [Rhodobium gokarnense]
MVQDVVVRPARASDLAACREMADENWRRSIGDKVAAEKLDAIVSRRHSDETLTRQLAEPDTLFLVGDCHDEIVAQAFLRKVEGGFFIDRLHVTLHRQGLGIGAKMMDALIERTAGTPLVAEVMADNGAARSFLTHCGFAPTDRQAALAAETGLAALVMERPPR